MQWLNGKKERFVNWVARKKEAKGGGRFILTKWGALWFSYGAEWYGIGIGGSKDGIAIMLGHVCFVFMGRDLSRRTHHKITWMLKENKAAKK